MPILKDDYADDDGMGTIKEDVINDIYIGGGGNYEGRPRKSERVCHRTCVRNGAIKVALLCVTIQYGI